MKSPGTGWLVDGRLLEHTVAIGNGRLWPIGEVHDRPLIQRTTGSATSAEEVKRETN